MSALRFYAGIPFRTCFKEQSRKPVLDVTFVGPSGEMFDYLMVFDTGADYTALPLHAGTILGLDFRNSSPKEGIGLGGGYLYYQVDQVQLTIHHPSRIDESFVCPVLFTDGLCKRSYGLLGREGVIDNVHFGICGREESLLFFGQHEAGGSCDIDPPHPLSSR